MVWSWQQGNLVLKYCCFSKKMHIFGRWSMGNVDGWSCTSSLYVSSGNTPGQHNPLTTASMTWLAWMPTGCSSEVYGRSGWSLVYKNCELGHNDLIWGRHERTHTRTSCIQNQCCIYCSWDLCRILFNAGRTDKRTNGQTDKRTDATMTHFIISAWAEAQSWAKKGGIAGSHAL